MNSPERKKVLFVLTKSDIGGAQKYVADLAAQLDPLRFNPITIHGGKELPHLSNAVKPWLFFINDWLAVADCVRAFQSVRPDIVHLQNSKAGIIGSLAAFFYNLTHGKKIKVVFTAHGWVFNPDNALSTPVRWLYIVLHRIAALFQDAIICVSEYDYELALDYHIAPARKLVMIHNGINPSSIPFLEKTVARAELIARAPELAAMTSKPWIGSIGRLTKEKDYGTFIRAAQEYPDAPWIIIGDGKEKEKLLTLNRTGHNPVIFVLPVGNDATFLKAFDVFAMTSIKEGLPYVILEAMAAGLPVTATAAGGIPEILKGYPSGHCVPQRNPAAFAAGIKSALQQSATKPIIPFPEEFSAEKMTEKTAAIYLF